MPFGLQRAAMEEPDAEAASCMRMHVEALARGCLAALFLVYAVRLARPHMPTATPRAPRWTLLTGWPEDLL